jgi:hypothetical protein
MKIKENFERQLSQNISTHLMLENLLPEIDKAVKTVHKKIKLGGKL